MMHRREMGFRQCLGRPYGQIMVEDGWEWQMRNGSLGRQRRQSKSNVVT